MLRLERADIESSKVDVTICKPPQVSGSRTGLYISVLFISVYDCLCYDMLCFTMFRNVSNHYVYHCIDTDGIVINMILHFHSNTEWFVGQESRSFRLPNIPLTNHFGSFYIIPIIVVYMCPIQNTSIWSRVWDHLNNMAMGDPLQVEILMGKWSSII